VAEHIIEHLALACKIPSDVMRRDNIYKEGQSTQFRDGSQPTVTVGKWNVPTMFDRMVTDLKVPERRAAIDEFNSRIRWSETRPGLVAYKVWNRFHG
jgi:xanthine dehydrogenase molybdopterin-binding subunit B